MSQDEPDVDFFTFPGAQVDLQLETERPSTGERGPELQLIGNRAGIASLANILLWFLEHGDRELLSISGLPFLRVAGSVSLEMRKLDEDGMRAVVVRTDKAEQFEWQVTDDWLKRLGLDVHYLVAWGGQPLSLHAALGAVGGIGRGRLRASDLGRSRADAISHQIIHLC